MEDTPVEDEENAEVIDGGNFNKINLVDEAPILTTDNGLKAVV